MNEWDRYARTWGTSAVPFGPLSETQGILTPSQQRALSLLNQTASLRSVMLLGGGNGLGKSALVGRWERQLESRLGSLRYVAHGFQALTPTLSLAPESFLEAQALP